VLLHKDRGNKSKNNEEENNAHRQKICNKVAPMFKSISIKLVSWAAHFKQNINEKPYMGPPARKFHLWSALLNTYRNSTRRIQDEICH